MVVLDVLGRRGALRVLWELRDGPLTFRALQEACESNPGSLNARLKDLRELGTVDHEDGGYRLSESGISLMETLTSLQAWSDQWAAQLPRATHSS
jgi:DNA-binding HxlR family transcriptional regulator